MKIRSVDVNVWNVSHCSLDPATQLLLHYENKRKIEYLNYIFKDAKMKTLMSKVWMDL